MVTAPQASALPATQSVARNARERNLPGRTKPARPLKTFRVDLDGQQQIIEARDADEAWALFCDARKDWRFGRSVCGAEVTEVAGK